MTTAGIVLLSTELNLSSTPKSLTRLAFETGFKPSFVALALRRLIQDGRCRYISTQGFVSWDEEELLNQLATDVCRDLIGRAYGEE